MCQAMNEYVMHVKHDHGKTRLVVHARNIAEAVSMLCAAEGCPERAIFKIEIHYK